MSDEPRGLDKYHAKTVQYGLSPVERAQTSYRYRTSQAELNDYVSAVKRALMAKGLPLARLNQALNLVRRLYRVIRGSEPDRLVESACANAVHWLDAGLSAAEVASVVESALAVQHGGLAEAGELQRMIEAMKVEQSEAGKERVVESDEVRMQKARVRNLGVPGGSLSGSGPSVSIRVHPWLLRYNHPCPMTSPCACGCEPCVARTG